MRLTMQRRAQRISPLPCVGNFLYDLSPSRSDSHLLPCLLHSIYAPLSRVVADSLRREPTRLETIGRSVRSYISAASRRASNSSTSSPTPLLNQRRTRPVSYAGGSITGFSPAAPAPTTAYSGTGLHDNPFDVEDDGVAPLSNVTSVYGMLQDEDEIVSAAWDQLGSTRSVCACTVG